MQKMRMTLFIFTVILVLAIGSITTSAKIPFDRTNMPGQMRVTATALNVRSGPSTAFTRVGMLYHNQIVDVLGRLGNWYIVHMDNDIVGVASGNYLKPYYPPSKPQATPAPAPDPGTGDDLTPPPLEDGGQGGEITANQKLMLDLINSERKKAGVQPLTFDKNIAKVAQIKAHEMVDRNYFSHTSPGYGSPFNMLTRFGIEYRSAGENLAGYRTVEGAHNGLMNSAGHRRNILNSSYNLVGIGIADSPRYGKIFVQMFVGR